MRASALNRSKALYPFSHLLDDFKQDQVPGDYAGTSVYLQARSDEIDITKQSTVNQSQVGHHLYKIVRGEKFMFIVSKERKKKQWYWNVVVENAY